MASIMSLAMERLREEGKSWWDLSPREQINYMDDAVARWKKLDPPWWEGTVIPTGQYRLKDSLNGRVTLQQLVTDTGGCRKRWVDCPHVSSGAPNDVGS